ncbi:hypothetical protein HMPREF0321_0709 [Dermacoccus sp. Ellin185]|nr:hypothetical protein HMPREF0321_0709 [Dermacoccus sp. Ellin185]
MDARAAHRTCGARRGIPPRLPGRARRRARSSPGAPRRGGRVAGQQTGV